MRCNLLGTLHGVRLFSPCTILPCLALLSLALLCLAFSCRCLLAHLPFNHELQAVDARLPATPASRSLTLIVLAPTPSPTPSPSSTASTSVSRSASASPSTAASVSPTPSASKSNTPSVSASRTASRTASPSRTASVSSSVSATPAVAPQRGQGTIYYASNFTTDWAVTVGSHWRVGGSAAPARDDDDGASYLLLHGNGSDTHGFVELLYGVPLECVAVSLLRRQALRLPDCPKAQYE